MRAAVRAVATLASCIVVEVTSFALGEESVCFAQLGARRLRQRETSDLADLLEASAEQPAAPLNPPAPAAASALWTEDTTTISPSDTTIFSPEERLGDEYSAYENEYQFGRPNIDAVASMNITFTTGPPELLTAPDGSVLPEAAAAPEASTTTVMVLPAVAPTESEEQLRNESALDCVVGEWSEWSDCSANTGDGLRSWHEVRYRPVVNPHQLGGLICLPLVMRRPCPAGGWSSQSSYGMYTYNAGGGGNGLPGGMSGSEYADPTAQQATTADGAAAAPCACGTSLLGTVIVIDGAGWKVGKHETMSLLRLSRTRDVRVGTRASLEAEEATLEAMLNKACLCESAPVAST